ncbi:Sulfite exporter TauE/SafE [compost metagenome]
MAVVTFVAAGRVSWSELAVLLGAASCGGYCGGALARKLPTRWLRWLVIAVGAGMTAYYFAIT